MSSSAGTPPPTCRSINWADTKELNKALKKVARALAQDDGFKDLTEIGAQLSTLNLTADGCFQSFTRSTKREPRENS